ncbi:MAG: glutamyl-tRNA synthetase, glutamyl-tRNA synthetase [Candidatus Nomurabacteria bacterium]|jgi:glutamyl-tRNA synthetase|nr:glutamyl-tRNA synthetase, glutamyl-tRNA synthetase [Candidatus Nomurabacteria bacterium]
MEKTNVVTRFAPSPTGNLHSGAYRTAIFSYLYARKHGGTFVLRIEDTDKERSKKEYEDNILESLQWLGLEYDVFVRQSENVARHQAVLEQLIADGHAYISKEAAKDGSGIIKEIIRFKNPNVDISFHDEIKGTVTMNTTDLGDFVIAKNITEPLFHLAVVVDDFDAGVTHVVRGEDHVSNTPRQILIQRAIGAPTPIYAHLPLVLGLDKQKLSKRKGALAVTEYRDLGYLPEALLNMVAMVGWNPGTEQELFSKEELITAFELSKVQKSPAIFNAEKLNWFNREYIKKLSSEMFWQHALSFVPNEYHNNDMLKKLEQLLRDRIEKFSDISELFAVGEFDYFFNNPTIDEKMLVWKTLKDDPEGLQKTKIYLKHAGELLESLTDWNYENVKNTLTPYAEQEGKGNVLWPLRVALSGKEKSPDPFELAGILGKEITLARIYGMV